jgi:eukaryotic-like serine/threonine-protein kinase
MECPHCKTSNPLGAASCSTCRTPLIDSGATLVAELTPPADRGDATIVDGRQIRPPIDPEATATGLASSSMEIPAAWSVPPTSQSLAEARRSISGFAPGSLVGNRYEIIKILGEGGMGAVYQARDRELDRTVALKVIRPELAGQPEILQRFKQELILARKITHRNVIRIFDLGEASGIKFITMEFIEGQDLKSVLAREHKLAPEPAVEIIQQVCLALEAAHSEGVVHRDLKPQNIMMDQKGRASVMDFGIARSLEFGGMTQTGAMIGTPEYMSPEQVRGEPADARSDIFTLGIIFQELLTGILPYQAETAMASMFKRTMERAASVHQVNPNVPPYLSFVVGKCLEIRPEDRYQTVKEVYDALEAWKSGAAKPIGIFSLRWFRRALRNRAAIGSAAAATALCIVVAAVVVYRMKHAAKTVVAHAPVSVLVADFSNQTGDPIFDGTLEPMMNVALEGASFINAFNRGQARQLAGKLPNPTSKLDEQAARLVGISQGVSTIVTGTLSKHGEGYQFVAQAVDAVTGKTLANTELSAANKDEVLLDVPKIVAPLRQALGDTTPESVQLNEAGGAFQAASLEAVHQYGLAMEQQFAGNMDAAYQSFSKAAELDPNFARAYAGMAGTSGNMGRQQDAEKYIKLAMEHVDRMAERERYRVRGVYYILTDNWQKCVDEYAELINRYPADNLGYFNAASCYAQMRNFPKALEAVRRAVEISPQGNLQRIALSFYSSYSGDFQSGEREAQKVLQTTPSHDAYLALAESEVGLGQLDQAADTYHKLEKFGATGQGASTAASGLADLAAYEGRFGDAVRTLEEAATIELAAKRPESAANKFAALAHIQILRGQHPAALEAAEKALANSQAVEIKFLVAQTFVEAGEFAGAQKLAADLAAMAQTEPQAYAKIITGESALNMKDASQAIKALTDANNLLDTWIGRFELGRADLQAGLFVEADSEFDRCIKRRGEALEILINNVPTYGYFPPVYYYQGLVRDGLKSAGFAESYRSFLSIRGKAGEDPLLPAVRKRLGN